jgi:hypothetical protein
MKEYTQELADIVCDYIMEGLSLRKIEAIEGMPNRRSILRWLRESPQFQTQYAHAREEQADFYADEMIEIADTEPDSAKARVRVDTRKWIASKLKSKKYGEATQIKHADADGNKFSLGSILNVINGTTANLPRPDEMPE